jgi:hypothetical protein
MPPALKRSNILGSRIPETRFQEEMNRMFDSLEDRMKAEDMEGSSKEKMMRYVLIGAVSLVVVGVFFAAVEFVK